MDKIKIYTCQRMTGRFKDEMRVEADMLVRVGENRGYTILNPVIEEHIPYEHDVLEPVPPETVARFWARDKEMIREADLVLDFNTDNRSDGSNKEIAYARFALWKPVVRVVSHPGFLISRLEDDVVVESLAAGYDLVDERFGSYEKLGKWRVDMLARSHSKWVEYQSGMNARYGIFQTEPVRPVGFKLEII